MRGCETHWLVLPGRQQVRKQRVSRISLEYWTGGRESRVGESVLSCVVVFSSSSELVEFAVNLAGPPAKPKYFLVTDSARVP